MKNQLLSFYLLLALTGLGILRAAPQLHYGVESRDVTLQQGFLFQITVQHDKEVPAPVLPAMQGFTVQTQPPQRSSFSNISIVNGRKNSVRYIKTVFNYTLIPQKLGTLTIPQVTVNVEGKKYHTRPIAIQVNKPEEYPGIFLEMKLSAVKCYVGEPVMIDWTWGFDRDIHGYNANLPVFQIPDFHFPDYMPPIDQQRYKYVRIGTFQQKELIGRQIQLSRNGRTQGGVKFQQPFIPTVPGTYAIPVSSITCEITDESRQRRSSYSDPFDDMDDFFGGFFNSRRTATKKITAVSRPVTLQVLPLPAENQPSSFSGIIGSCRISTAASPLEVNVGEPIILTLKIAGPKILDKVHLPDLEKQENIAADFKISSTDPGIIKNGEKIFQRTLRANSPDVHEIPPVEVSYFNSKTGKYEIARSQAISIKVTAAREITTRDMQGLQMIQPTTKSAENEAPESRELQATSLGIAHNYDSSQLLYSQSRDFLAWLRRPLTAILLVFPVLLWFSLWAGSRCRRNSRQNLEERKIRNAGHQCLKQLKKLKCGSPDTASRLYDILQDYFALRLRRNPGTVSSQDLAQAAAADSHLTDEVLPVLTEIISLCEFSRFAGSGQPISQEQLKRTIKAVQCWEKHSR